MDEGNTSVVVESFAEGHFIKSFKKKHKAHWDSTFSAIIAQLERIDNLLRTDKAEHICDAGEAKIIKTKFRISGTTESAKTSGNRCIVAWYVERRQVSVLLVYGKTDIPGRNETSQWKNIVREAYPEFRRDL
ncbi:MAG: hypothetical protein QG636_127 [Patescibacteria group bacterium]|jgi:hypothetical protein|nr:hypothetical protein [Patescibacteria group bacterium]